MLREINKVGKQMVWSETEQKMVSVAKKNKSKNVKVAISLVQFEMLKSYANRDGFDLSGISYETERDKNGKTKHDKDGNTIFKLDENGIKITHVVTESAGKLNSAIASYVNIAIAEFIAQQPKA